MGFSMLSEFTYLYPEGQDTSFLGIPTEGHCFSKNAQGIFGPPDSDKVKFTFKEKYTAEIEMV